MIKGEIWWAAERSSAHLPDNPYGSEPGKRRPVLIIQNDAFNRSEIRATMCAIITSNMKLAQMPGNITLVKGVSGQIKKVIDTGSKIYLKEGDKIIFFERNDGEVVINNASATAIINAQKAFEGAARDFGVDSEEGVQRLVDEVRYGGKK